MPNLLTRAQQEVLAIVQAANSHGLNTDEITAKTQYHRTTVTKALRVLRSQGRINQGPGTRNTLWWTNEAIKPTAQKPTITTVPIPAEQLYVLETAIAELTRARQYKAALKQIIEILEKLNLCIGAD